MMRREGRRLAGSMMELKKKNKNKCAKGFVVPSLNWYKPLLRTRPYGGVRHCDGWAGTETSRCDAQRNSPRKIYYTPPLCCPHRWKGKKETWTNRASDCWCSSFHFVNGFTQPREWMQGRNRERRFLYFGRNDIVAFIPRAFLAALLYWLMYSARFSFTSITLVCNT